MKGLPPVSVVIPVKNGADMLGRCLGSLKNADYPPERLEIIVADGMSRDDTKGVAAGHGAKVVPNDKELVVSGRNRGFEASAGEIIAFTDADCVFDKGWLKESIKYFDDPKVGGVGGLTLAPEESSAFEKAIDLIFSIAESLGTTVHRKGIMRAEEADDIPGCNAIYRRAALAAVMPVDEGLLTAEDVWMNSLIRKAGYRLILAPDVILRHYRRNSPAGFFRQAYRFAVGRTQIGKRDAKLMNVFHIVTGLAIPAFLATGVSFYLAGAQDLFFKIVSLLLAAVILASLFRARSLKTAINVPLAIAIFVSGWSLGFLRELLFPMKDVRGK
ncbi:MAG: glycosyltransferase [Candidatus Omnitrophota bacterium]